MSLEVLRGNYCPPRHVGGFESKVLEIAVDVGFCFLEGTDEVLEGIVVTIV